MKSDEFDRAFDDGEDVTSQLDMSAARRPGLEQRRVNVGRGDGYAPRTRAAPVEHWHRRPQISPTAMSRRVRA
jgi:hypothetical protein